MFSTVDQFVIRSLSGVGGADAISRAAAGVLLCLTPLCVALDVVRLRMGVFGLLSGFIFMALAYAIQSRKAWLMPGFIHALVRAYAVFMLAFAALFLIPVGGFLSLLSVLQVVLLAAAFYFWKAARYGKKSA